MDPMTQFVGNKKPPPLKQISKKKNKSTHCKAIKVVFLFVSKNGFWGIKKQIFFSFYGVFLKLSKLEFQST